MADYSTAINDLRFLETRFKNIIEIIPHLAELGSLENAIDEAKRQIDALKADIESLGKSKADAEDALGEARKVIDNRKADFDAWLETATKSAKNGSEALLKDAQDKAQGLITEAQIKADSIATAVKQDQALLDSLKIKIADATTQYADIQTKLQTIKASL